MCPKYFLVEMREERDEAINKMEEAKKALKPIVVVVDKAERP